jgi:hypothetical protein
MGGTANRASQGTPQQPSKGLIPQNNKARKTPTGGKKAFQQNMMGMFTGASGHNTVTGAGAGSLRDSAGQIASSALTGDQLRFMM